MLTNLDEGGQQDASEYEGPPSLTDSTSLNPRPHVEEGENLLLQTAP